MAESVEDDDKWLYSTGDPSVETNDGNQLEENGDKQTDDLSQIFDNQVMTAINSFIV